MLLHSHFIFSRPGSSEEIIGTGSIASYSVNFLFPSQFTFYRGKCCWGSQYKIIISVNLLKLISPDKAIKAFHIILVRNLHRSVETLSSLKSRNFKYYPWTDLTCNIYILYTRKYMIEQYFNLDQTSALYNSFPVHYVRRFIFWKI